MEYSRCSPRIGLLLFWAVAFCVVIGLGLYMTLDRLMPFFLVQPWINGAILAIGGIGLVVSLWELIRLQRQGSLLDSLASEITSELSAPIDEVVMGSPHSLVRDRCARILTFSLRGALETHALSLLSDADAESEQGRGAFVRYVLGVMIFLGLIGTFWGLLLTVSGVHQVLLALEPSRIDNPVEFVTQLKSSMGGMLGGLSTAFSTSLFGLGGSVILGFVDMQTRKARSIMLSDLDRFVVSFILPRQVPQGSPVVEARPVVPAAHEARLYLTASQEALAENLRRLTEVISLQSSSDESLAEALVEIKGMLEALRDDQKRNRDEMQAANQVRRDLLEQTDTVGRRMERLINETRLNREALDDQAKAILERLKLEGEITNKTLSMGFSDVIRTLNIMGDRTRGSRRTESDGT